MQTFNQKLGLALFVVYLLFYCGFVFLNAFSAELMEKRVIAGVNLAIVYGIALIVGAFLLAVVYGILCRREPDEEPATPQTHGDSHS